MNLTDRPHSTEQDEPHQPAALCHQPTISRSSQVKPGDEVHGSGLESARHTARHWHSCSVAQTEMREEALWQRGGEAAVSQTFPLRSSSHTALGFKARQLHQKQVLSRGNETPEGSEMGGCTQDRDGCLYRGSHAPLMH